MRSIARGQLEGFPPAGQLKTVYVEHDLQVRDGGGGVFGGGGGGGLRREQDGGRRFETVNVRSAQPRPQPPQSSAQPQCDRNAHPPPGIPGGSAGGGLLGVRP